MLCRQLSACIVCLHALLPALSACTPALLSQFDILAPEMYLNSKLAWCSLCALTNSYGMFAPGGLTQSNKVLGSLV
eukprot:5035818-Pyramimonas_sp.AAC.1